MAYAAIPFLEKKEKESAWRGHGYHCEQQVTHFRRAVYYEVIRWLANDLFVIGDLRKDKPSNSVTDRWVLHNKEKPMYGT